MRGAPIAFAAAVVGVVFGVAALLAGEAWTGYESLVPVGGAVALLSVGALTLTVDRLESPSG